MTDTAPDTKITITIPNWDKYQRPLKGNGGAAGARRWFAIDTNMFRDHAYLALSERYRMVWLSLLNEAAIHGNPFTICLVTFRKLYDIRRGFAGKCGASAFDPLVEQGLIKIGARRKQKKPLLQDNTIQNKTNTIKAERDFEIFWGQYPLKKKKQKAKEIWINGDFNAQLLVADIANRLSRDRQWCDGFIPHPTTYLNQKLWTDSIEPLRKKKTIVPSDPNQLLALAKELSVQTKGRTTFEVQKAIREKLNG